MRPQGKAERLVLLLALLCSASVIAQVSEPYAWPLEQPRVLTSSFGEYRVDRFHMGIDLRTGPVGKKVYAAEAGYVARVRCSPYGYGKVVYLRLNDGNMAIYAHLSEFMPELRDYVRQAQHDREDYTVDLYPDPEEFPVSRGQLIARSGQTGIGVPHLHWEIRDGGGVPINLRLLNLSWPDTSTPRFRGILVIPRTPETTINGDYLPVVIPVEKTGADVYTAGSIYVRGKVAFGVDVYDPANGGGTKLGVHRIVTRVDGESVFEMIHDRIGYVHAGDGGVAYHPYYLDKGRFLMQWPWPGVATELYGGKSIGGEISAGDSKREVVIEARDFFDNPARVRITIVPGKNMPEQVNLGSSSGRGTVLYDAVGDWLLITVRFSEAETLMPILLESGKPSGSAHFDRVSSTLFRARYRPGAGTVRVGLGVDHPRAGLDATSGMVLEHEFFIVNEQGSAVRGEIGAVGLDIPAESVYGRLFVTAGTAVGVVAEELTPIGPAYRIWPESAPLRNGITVSLPWPESGDRGEGLGVYRKRGRSWRWVPATRGGDSIRFETSKLGTFQLMVDTTPPAVKFRAPSRSGAVRSRTPEIKIFIDDKGSGISGWSAGYNGEWLLMVYDPEQDLLTWERDVSLASGSGELLVRVTDNAGNETVRSMQLTVPRE